MELTGVDVDELVALATSGRLAQLVGVPRDQPSLVVSLAPGAGRPGHAVSDAIGTVPVVLIGVGSKDHPAAGLVDLVVADDNEARAVATGVTARPLASVALALLLRHGEHRTVAAGLVAESATYSVLQSGPEFASWRQAWRPRRTAPASAPEVVVEHRGSATTITLNRPDRHNAVDTALSEQLVAALTDAVARPATHVTLRGTGPSFCSGGDLDEFGSFSDPATAHTVRLARSAGHLVSLMAERVEVQLHGASMGAGIELAAFAGHVVAAPGARIALPEIGLGLVPGAGGTASLPRRIGRWRTCLLALTGRELDAATALEWGLVDAIC